MFGSSNRFGQSSNSSLFGTQTQSMFGQANNVSNNLFAPKPSGTSTPFGAQTGSSMFGGTSTGAFGAPQPSSPFGAASQAFGNSTPAFGASSAPAFGSSASPFGGSSTFGQKSFGFSKPQSSLFGSSTQQSQPAFGNSTFGTSTPFGASSTPAFGASSAPAIGASSTPAFGASTTPAFGASSMPAFGGTTTPTFGATGTLGFGTTSTPGFGATSTPGFGASSTPGFGASSIPAFGSSNTPAFGASSTPSFGASSSPALGASSSQPFGSSGTPFGINAFGSGGGFGGSSTSAFGASSTPGFGASNTSTFGASTSNTPSFSFGSSPAFGQSTSAFGSGSFGSAQSPFGAQGAHPSTSTFGGQSTNGVQQGGSRIMPYSPTTETDSGTDKLQSKSAMGSGKLQSISAMSVYKEKNHEELRWEDYQQGDKGGKLPVGRSPVGAGFQPSIFSPSPTFGPTTANPANPFSSSIATNSFVQKTPTTFPKFSSHFGQSSTPTCGQTTTSSFGPTTTSSIFVKSTSSNTTSGLGSSPGFATATSQPMGSLNFGPASSHGFTPTFSTGGNFSNSHSSPLFSSNPSFRQNTTPVFEQTSSAVGQNTNPVSGQTNNFNAPSAGFGNPSSSSSSLTTSISPIGQTTPVGLTPNPSVQPAQQSSGPFGFNNFGQTQIGNTTGVTGGMGSFGLGNFGSASANTVVMQPPVTNPFGTLPASRQISISQSGKLSSIQYGISSMPVVDKPISVRGSRLLTSRHLQQRRVRLPTRKYRPDDDGPKVPFFSNLEENSCKPKADVLFIRRENPRALLIRPVERLRSEDPKDGLTSLHENDKPDKNSGETREAPPVKPSQKPNMTYENHRGDTNGPHSTSPSGVDIESLMPKLHHPEYFTEPRIQQLATKEKVDPGYCKRVKDFVVGRHGYGSIKFLGETDVTNLDLEILVRFSNREVIVYMDESKKPPVGQGLNKPALVTLLNIKCKDKKSGRQVKEGERLDKYKEMLKKKAEEQGAKFVTYDAVNGVWTFKVEHF